MCGIVGYVGPRELNAEVLRGLGQLEYRGYDSAGVATRGRGGSVRVTRSLGHVGKLADRLSENTERGGVAIGHTRWATHGEPSQANAHPHMDCTGQLAVVHNGIIENHGQLRAVLERQGHRFRSDTDSECIAHLIESENHGNLLSAVRRSVTRLQGTFALAAISKHRDEMVVARRGSPLVIGVGDEEFYVASDVTALLERTRKVVFLEDGDIAHLSGRSMRVHDARGRRVWRGVEEIRWSAVAASKCGYDSFLRKEIDEQPAVVRDALRSPQRLDVVGPLVRSAPSNVLMVGCGTSYHAGVLASEDFRRATGLRVDVEIASEFRLRLSTIPADTLVIAISQSGETADTLACLEACREAGLPTLAVCNVQGSTMTRRAHATVLTQAGPEISVASTKAFITQVVTLRMVATAIGQQLGELEESAAAVRNNELHTLPEALASTLELDRQIQDIARKSASQRAFAFLGRGSGFAVAREGALKLQELAYVPSLAYPSGEIKHGPIALIDESVTSLFVVEPTTTHTKTIGSMAEIRARRGRVIAIAAADDQEARDVADHVLELPEVPPELFHLLASVVFQLFAHHVATELGHDVDRPRNLAKSVTVE